MFTAHCQSRMQIESGKRPAAYLPDIIGSGKGDHDSWPFKIFGNAGGNDTDDAGVPVRACQHQGRSLIPVRVFSDHFPGLFEDFPFNLLPILIELLQIHGQCASPFFVVSCEQFDGEPSLRESSRGIDSGGNGKTDVLSLKGTYLKSS